MGKELVEENKTPNPSEKPVPLVIYLGFGVHLQYYPKDSGDLFSTQDMLKVAEEYFNKMAMDRAESDFMKIEMSESERLRKELSAAYETIHTLVKNFYPHGGR